MRCTFQQICQFRLTNASKGWSMEYSNFPNVLKKNLGKFLKFRKIEYSIFPFFQKQNLGKEWKISKIYDSNLGKSQFLAQVLLLEQWPKTNKCKSSKRNVLWITCISNLRRIYRFIFWFRSTIHWWKCFFWIENLTCIFCRSVFPTCILLSIQFSHIVKSLPRFCFCENRVFEYSICSMFE